MRNFCVAVLILLVASLLGAQPGQCVSQKVLQEGGPYTSTTISKIQRFAVPLTVTKQQQGFPIWITFYNGYGGKPGYSWVRVFLTPAGETASDNGQILVDEHTFLRKNAVTIDLSGSLNTDGNQLVIEGEGEAGAIFDWVLTTVKEDLAVLDSTPVISGKTCLIHGVGFSTNKDDNKVSINNSPAEVLSATPRILSVKVPDGIKGGGTVPLSVTVGSKTSNPIQARCGTLPPHITGMSPYGGPVGGVLNITGTGFSRVPAENVVNIGPYVTGATGVMPDGTLIVPIPNWGDSSGTLPVRVITNGVPSNNQVQFWCTPHYYGGDPNATAYQID